MKIILSPAKRMHEDTDFWPVQTPLLLDKALSLWEYMKSLSLPELQRLLCCNDALAREAFDRYHRFDPRKAMTPALLAYDGIQYRYMAPQVFEESYFEYAQEHVRILSGLYGILRPFDGVVPYRLEMQARLRTRFCRDLYDYWGGGLADAVLSGDRLLINLASREYSRAVLPHLPAGCDCITCRFAERQAGRLIEKGVYVKMARGEMIRYMAQHHIENAQDIKAFDRLGYAFEEAASDDHTFVFVQKQ